jgi:hypothetical protein
MSPRVWAAAVRKKNNPEPEGDSQREHSIGVLRQWAEARRCGREWPCEIRCSVSLVCWLLLAVPGMPPAPPTDDDQIGELKEVAMV